IRFADRQLGNQLFEDCAIYLDARRVPLRIGDARTGHGPSNTQLRTFLAVLRKRQPGTRGDLLGNRGQGGMGPGHGHQPSPSLAEEAGSASARASASARDSKVRRSWIRIRSSERFATQATYSTPGTTPFASSTAAGSSRINSVA